MVNNYNSRKAKKYLPFDALTGYKESIVTADYEYNKGQMPQISEDDYERINLVILDCYATNRVVNIAYFHDGYLKTTVGVIKKLDLVTNKLILEDKMKISLNQVVDVCEKTL